MIKPEVKTKASLNQQPGEKSISIHGHFYQPPREDPISNEIPNEKGSAPYNNWNEKILAQCYRPNAELGNYEYISFNMGPTLLQWLQEADPVTYYRIIAQDAAAADRFGTGTAIAQSYNHTILPLATFEDKTTQVYWGIQDFKHRFKRDPLGIWLPETAVDEETLEVLSFHDIEFTILAPWQAEADGVNPTQPYRVPLKNGRDINVFFYERDLSGGISFDQEITTNAHNFMLRNVLPVYESNNGDKSSQLILVATDGELYGHHQMYRDWFLAYLVNGATARAGVKLTIPGEYLQKHPPVETIKIRDFTSWSCHHGVERWRNSCGCTPNSGGWKNNLRVAFDNVAYIIDQVFWDVMNSYHIDPLAVRNEYIHVILEKITEDEFISQFISPNLSEKSITTLKLLLKSQFERQKIYTSCGFFFEDFDRIEPVNNIAYAAQSIYLTRKATGIDLFDMFRKDLSKVVSHTSGLSGDRVLDQFIQRLLSRNGSKP